MKMKKSSHQILSILMIQVLAGRAEATGSEKRTKYGCEGSDMKIECEEGTVINLIRANYGRFSISICNSEGNTAWSVNCMEPRTLRIINQRCEFQPRCNVPVNSSIFGDPCPGTSKYVEVHFSCKSLTTTAVTKKPQPPWLYDLSATPSAEWQLMTSTIASAVQRTSMSGLTSTTKKKTTSLFLPEASIYTSSTPRAIKHKPTELPAFVNISTVKSINRTVIYSQSASLFRNHCHPLHTRGLFWNWTRVENMAIQPCPGGSSGFARWKCDSNGEWTSESPDLSECQAHWINRLESRLRNGESVIKVSTDLAAVTETRRLYGGDILIITRLMQSLAHRLTQDLLSISSLEQKDTLVTELMQNIQKTGSNLLDDYQEDAWLDLKPELRSTAGTALILGMEENAFLVADTLNNENNIVDETNNIVSSIRIMSTRNTMTQNFPHFPYLHMAEQAHLEIPMESMRQHGVNGAVRLIFLLYDKMERVLPSALNGVKFLNSKVVSTSVSKGRHNLVSAPIKLTLRHINFEGVSNPSCMWWNYVTKLWSEENCEVVSTNVTHTSCHCKQFGNIAILMEVGREEKVISVTPRNKEDKHKSLGTLVGVIVSIVSGVCLAVIGFFIIRRMKLQNNLQKYIPSGSLPCFHCQEKPPGGLYPESNSSPTSTTLSSDATTHGTTISSNYFLNAESCARIARNDPIILSPVLGQPTTIYRTKLANGQEAHVIPVSGIQIPEQSRNMYFRPESPQRHIYMEIDPVYNPPTQREHYQCSDQQLSDVSDDDLRRCSDISRQSSNRYAEERPLIQNTYRAGDFGTQKQTNQSAKYNIEGHNALDTVSERCHIFGSLRCKGNCQNPRLPSFVGQPDHAGIITAPITIALSPEGEKFVSLNMNTKSGCGKKYNSKDNGT